MLSKEIGVAKSRARIGVPIQRSASFLSPITSLARPIRFVITLSVVWLAGSFFNVLATFSGDAEFAFVLRDKCKVFFLRNCAFGFLRLISISIVYALMIGLTRLKLQDGVFAGPNPDVGSFTIGCYILPACPQSPKMRWRTICGRLGLWIDPFSLIPGGNGRHAFSKPRLR